MQKWLQELGGIDKENDEKGINGADESKMKVGVAAGDRTPAFGKEGVTVQNLSASPR